MNRGTMQAPDTHIPFLTMEPTPTALWENVCVSFTLCLTDHCAPCCFLQFPPLVLRPPLFHSSESVCTPQGSFLITPPHEGLLCPRRCCGLPSGTARDRARSDRRQVALPSGSRSPRPENEPRRRRPLQAKPLQRSATALRACTAGALLTARQTWKEGIVY